MYFSSAMTINNMNSFIRSLWIGIYPSWNYCSRNQGK